MRTRTLSFLGILSFCPFLFAQGPSEGKHTDSIDLRTLLRLYNRGTKPDFDEMKMQGPWVGECYTDFDSTSYTDAMWITTSSFNHQLPFHIKTLSGKSLVKDDIEHVWRINASFKGCNYTISDRMDGGAFSAFLSPLYETPTSWQYTHLCSVNKIFNDYNEIHEHNFRMYQDDSSIYIIRKKESSEHSGEISNEDGTLVFRNVSWKYQNKLTEICYFTKP